MNKKYSIVRSIFLSFLMLSACGIKERAEVQYTSKEFPLSIELDKTEYKIGDMLSFTLTIANKCGKTVTLYSNGKMPCVDFQNLKNRLPHSDISALSSQELKENEKLSRNFNFQLEEAGTYILATHYIIAINSSNTENWFEEKLDDIEITVAP